MIALLIASVIFESVAKSVIRQRAGMILACSSSEARF